ncbi:nucleotide disphospho-sugar-binding domain-containing protein [Streptomyces sp. L2]|uniref:nucleotide disphospho-sugar-binding domain-containing protein n=1 Tax=Streptomyces sp. L2 TaxID=2162665 RepID=UPI0010111A08|nr:nucleotide disphospho-sugar-binding domain-containing protein [Streptomyces sp. L2]
MRALLVTWAAPGHLFPMVPLAWALTAAGHDVRIAAPPACTDAIVAAGLPAVAVGRPVDLKSAGNREDFKAWYEGTWPAGWATRPELLNDAQARTLRAATTRQTLVADAMLDDLVAFTGTWRPDLVVHDPLCLAGPVIAAVCGVPSLAHGWEVGTVTGTDRDPRSGEQLPEYLRLFEKYGVEPRPATGTLIDPAPPSTSLGDSLPVRRVPVRHVPYNGPGAVPPAPTGPRTAPRIVFTTGVALSRTDTAAVTRALADMLETTRGMDADIVLAVGAGQRALLPPLPDRVEVAEAVPMHLLLAGADAVVHHGGAGTALAAVHCGVPQLVLPRSPIYSETGHRIAASGAGTVLVGDDQHPVTAAPALAGLLGDGPHRTALTALRAELDALPSPAEVALHIEDLLRIPAAV